MLEKPLYISTVPAGQIRVPEAGDFILTHEDRPMSKVIRFGQRLRFRGADKKYARWNHAAYCLGVWTLMEALGTGVQLSPLSKYKDVEYVIVRPESTHLDRVQAAKFAYHCRGQSYGFLTILGVGLWAVFGGRFDFSLDGTEICSQLVARCLERSGHIFDRDPCRVTPADLAKHFSVV